MLNCVAVHRRKLLHICKCEKATTFELKCTTMVLPMNGMHCNTNNRIRYETNIKPSQQRANSINVLACLPKIVQIAG